MDNIRKDLEAGFDEVVVVVLSPEIGKRIKDEIADLGLLRKERIKIIWQQRLFQEWER